MTENKRLEQLDIDALRAQQAHFQKYVDPWKERIVKIINYYNEVDTEARATIKNATETLPDAVKNDFLIAVALPFTKEMKSASELREDIKRAEVELSDLTANKPFVEDLTKNSRLYRDRCERLALRISELEKAAQAYRDAIAVSAVVDAKDALALRVLSERRDMFNARYADVEWLITVDLKPALERAIDTQIVKEIK